ncbi:MAG: acetate kinase, partial [Streptomyces sp.]
MSATRVLVLNSGSSSVKYQLLDMRDSSRLAVGLVERIGEATSRLKHTPLTGGRE